MPIARRVSGPRPAVYGTYRWPAHVDIPACRRFLWTVYEQGRALNMHIMMMTDSKHMDQRDLMKRLGSSDPRALTWLCEAPLGNVRFLPRHPYESRIFHSFGNVVARKEMLKLGTTHVAVGFLDLAPLAAACHAAGWRAAGIGGVAPLVWVGYDSSAYAVAKTMVVAHMLHAGCETAHILQIWYSAAWSKPTLRTFRAAVTSILASPTTTVSSSSTVQVLHLADCRNTLSVTAALLRHWQVEDVSLAKSRSGWFEKQTTFNCNMGNFKKKADRMALCAYAITGQLLEAEVGSVVMFAVPESLGCGERAFDEHFLQTLPPEEVIALRASGATDVVTAAVALLTQRIDRLSSLMRAGWVTVEIRLGAVEPSATATLKEIRALNPYTMSWSNVCDYVAPEAFHAMARACSAPEDTVHYLHSMNWIRDVKGTFYIDYLVSFRGGPELTQRIFGMLEAGRAGIKMLYDTTRWAKFALTPPVDSPRNVLDFGLYVAFYRGWLDSFAKFGVAKLKDVRRQTHIAYPPVYSVFSRTNSTIYLTFTFDSAISFQVQPSC